MMDGFDELERAKQDIRRLRDEAIERAKQARSDALSADGAAHGYTVALEMLERINCRNEAPANG